MSDKRKPEQVVASFAEHVAALRSTLPQEEQAILDQAIDGLVIAVDVQAHAFTDKFRVVSTVSRAATNSAIALEAVAAQEKDDIEDVEAHAFAAEAIPTWALKVAEGAVMAERVDPNSSIPSGY